MRLSSILTGYVVCVLNWEALEHRCLAPLKASIYAASSRCQVEQLVRLSNLRSPFCCLASGIGCDLGRALQKTKKLTTALTFLWKES